LLLLLFGTLSSPRSVEGIRSGGGGGEWSLRAEKVCLFARGENLVGEILESSISSFLLHASYEA
jgi:hypothetical protein